MRNTLLFYRVARCGEFRRSRLIFEGSFVKNFGPANSAGPLKPGLFLEISDSLSKNSQKLEFCKYFSKISDFFHFFPKLNLP